MALPLPAGLTPPEVAFLCEMELVTVIPRQRLESLQLLGGITPALQPPHRNDIPLWLALLLKKQKRANIIPPPWLHPASLSQILEFETEHSKEAFSPPPKLPPGSSTTSPPFLPSATAEAQPDALPYHWLELGEMLLQAAPDDFEDVDQVRRLMRDLREVRMAKLRAGVDELDAAGGLRLNGVGGMELAEGRLFIGGVIDGLRKINASKEQARREREAEEQENGYAGGGYDDDDML
ncbi:DNA replication complex GINS protein PSF2 [Verruconis gallopava]|uniref:DNA replication complex GINS protein PSF2 n=1 Tax=Verruconis gallopava TaxID=253628 RepID=A0A0D1YWS3_9PEZI|nr:DNA replication complex GINS protein PSF2 [Verruconis gallopava]KIW05162.1 DNA replication complex GINS protein PSF2 [Verruconis gallopava]